MYEAQCANVAGALCLVHWRGADCPLPQACSSQLYTAVRFGASPLRLPFLPYRRGNTVPSTAHSVLSAIRENSRDR